MNLLKIVLRTLLLLMQLKSLMVAFLNRSNKPVMKGSRVESNEEARNEYKKLLEEGGEKTYRFNS